MKFAKQPMSDETRRNISAAQRKVHGTDERIARIKALLAERPRTRREIAAELGMTHHALTFFVSRHKLTGLPWVMELRGPAAAKLTRERLAADTREFVANGGSIEKCPAAEPPCGSPRARPETLARVNKVRSLMAGICYSREEMAEVLGITPAALDSLQQRYMPDVRFRDQRNGVSVPKDDHKPKPRAATLARIERVRELLAQRPYTHAQMAEELGMRVNTLIALKRRHMPDIEFVDLTHCTRNPKGPRKETLERIELIRAVLDDEPITRAQMAEELGMTRNAFACFISQHGLTDLPWANAREVEVA